MTINDAMQTRSALRMRTLLTAIGTAVLILQLGVVKAQEPLLVVTDPWPPYTHEENNTVTGMDAEIIRAVFEELDIPITIQSFPWKRCLLMMKSQEADAILDASPTPERLEFMSFPEEPVSEGVTVFFVKKGRDIPFRQLDDLNALRAGTLLGYNYCDEIDNAAFTKNSERVRTLEQSLNMLLAGRVDFVIEVDAVGYSTARKMGVLDQLDTIPNARFCQGGNYLAFSKKKSNDAIVGAFSKALTQFKTTEKYAEILARYGMKVPQQP